MYKMFNNQLQTNVLAFVFTMFLSFTGSNLYAQFVLTGTQTNTWNAAPTDKYISALINYNCGADFSGTFKVFINGVDITTNPAGTFVSGFGSYTLVNGSYGLQAANSSGRLEIYSSCTFGLITSVSLVHTGGATTVTGSGGWQPYTAGASSSSATVTPPATTTLSGGPAGGTFSVISGGGSISGNIYTPPIVSVNTNVTVRYTVTSGNCPTATADATFVVTPPACAAGTTAPTLSGTTKTNTCPATTANISSLITSTTPSGASLVWFTNNAHTGTAYSTPTTAAAGTYYAFYYDATGACYSPASAAVTATINTCAAPVTFGTPTPAGQTATLGQAKSGNAATELAPTGGTSPYVYSNGSTDPACVAPSGATALPAGSNLTVNSSTGAYTYTAPTTAGTYYFCMKVCDSASTPSCKIATYTLTVSATCIAGSAAPILIKN